MNLSTHVLGSHTVTYIRERAEAALLEVGNDRFTRADFSRVKCWNFAAAANLSKVLNKHLNVRDLRDVFDRIPPSALALPRIGGVSLAVLGAAFEAKRIGGSNPLEAWIAHHKMAMSTFDTIKKHELADERAEKKAKKRERRANGESE